MQKRIDSILSMKCPLVGAILMIEMMVDFKYRANRHYWKASEKIVKTNLKKRLELDLRWYGYTAICDQFFEYFNLNCGRD